MVTIIVPTYSEEKNILSLQKNIDILLGKYEVIFSDGFSTDNTFSLIKYPKIQAVRGRAKQMNVASKYAKGDYLLFLHADCRLEKNAILQIENSNAEIGCFKIKFDDERFSLKMLAFFSNLRVLTRNIAFGDQGIFIKKIYLKNLMVTLIYH